MRHRGGEHVRLEDAFLGPPADEEARERRPWRSRTYTPRPDTRPLRLPLEGADVGEAAAVAVAVAGPADAALVGGGGAGVVALVDGRAARQQRVGPGGAAVAGQGAEPGVDGVGGRAHHVPVDAVGEAGGARAVADQVVPAAG